MNENWLWLPDFASDLGLWEDDLVGVAPAADHVFVPYEKLAVSLDKLYNLEGMSDASTVVGWGLGAFTMLMNAKDRPKGQKWILLAPFADYCSDESEWTTENLSFIAHQTLTAVDATINAFYELLEDELGEWQDDWLKKAKSVEPDLLRVGLEYMAKNRIESPVDTKGDVQVLFGRMDRAVLPSMTLALKEFLPQAEFKERPKAGHWPPMLLF
jgi:pimeloyl-ACP methyl ester carboxylesterase